jgi:hypothetical protein
MHSKFWSEKLKETGLSDDLGVYGRIILYGILQEQVGKLWTGFIWLRTGTSDGIL